MKVIHKPKPDPRLMTQTKLIAYVHELEADKQELLIRHNLSINAYIAKINAFGETIKNLKAENSRLEESFQKATGTVAADALPTFAEMRKVSEMCKHNKCKSKNKKCPYFNAESSHCRFDDGADHWDFGGADDEIN